MKKLVPIVFFLLWNCKPIKEIKWSEKGTIISIDTVSIKTYKDSNRIDTMKFSKRTYYKSISPKSIHGEWYLVVGIIGILAMIFLKR
jgi:hypothetical protein